MVCYVHASYVFILPTGTYKTECFWITSRAPGLLMIYKYSKIPHNRPLWEQADVGKKSSDSQKSKKTLFKNSSTLLNDDLVSFGCTRDDV